MTDVIMFQPPYLPWMNTEKKRKTFVKNHVHPNHVNGIGKGKEKALSKIMTTANSKT